MELPPRVASAMNAMKALGLSWEITKPVLKDLLKVYKYNWEHIECENYRVLADAILDSLELMDNDLKKITRRDDDLDKKVDVENNSFSGKRAKVENDSFSGKRAKVENDLFCGKRAKPSNVACFDKRPSHEPPKNEHKNKASTTIINISLGDKPRQLENPISSAAPPRPLPARIVGSSSSRESSLHDNGKNASTDVDRSAQNSSSIRIELASSLSGEVRLVILYDPALPCPNFQIPSLEILCKMVEDRCLKSYKILEPHFSLLSLLKEMCHCVMELSSNSSEERGNIDRFQGMNPIISNGQPEYVNLQTYSNNKSERGKDSEDIRNSEALANDSLGLVVFQPQHSSSSTKTVAFCDTDISRGEENLKISLANGPAERYPPYHYIPRNIVYQNAYVNISLARIGDEDCCSTCSGDCLAASIPCPCARETGGDYAYTSDGLMKNEFLNAIISMKRDRLQKHLYFCKDCPIERIRNEMMPEPCKGHLIRKFVKECWSKCGCNRICGNRLVQRGITRNLQVFWTVEGKGWGLRTLEELPMGAFICEYVGEILTNTELFDRQLLVTGKMRHTYPVLLDADWGSEQVLKDEEALCLDATFYGNVARFINHRCGDANIVEVPVEVETPDHHYYHLAFFTVRKVEALEELTWDYGIDFDDQTHPIKAFSCRCGSKLCRTEEHKLEKDLPWFWDENAFKENYIQLF
ncbi:hypothetical protein KFK09_009662 [Dendrobium nobile]|uniref:Uncharacterized protein n=1 Tax=Dendrobium nobile TaxID=94219 RepID=A0A8T3BM24_DENNO|nr:hypothetical protein KFK09_009662 [Dendrobium nobile]